MKLSQFTFRLQSMFLVSAITFFAFIDTQKSNNTIATSIKKHYEEQLNLFIEQINEFQTLELSNASENDLKIDFLQLRENYKELELFLVYNENRETQGFNGANLAINEYTYQTPADGLEPHGLQVMEDLIYNPNGNQSRLQLREEIKRFSRLTTTFLNRSRNIKVDNGEEYAVIIWDAIRLEIYRIESLGITGFDVPDSQNSLPETIAALKSIKTIINFYKPLFSKYRLKTELTKGTNLLNNAILFIEANNDFNSFDRLTFIRSYLHPFSTWLKQNCDVLNLTFPSNISPINRNATHLFEKTIFNANYFFGNSTSDKIELGKKLFNDKRLSGNNERSCATCHHPDKGYADGLAKNTAINSTELLVRNTPSLWNVGYQTKLFYDSRVKSLEKQSLAVIHNPLEMGGNLDSIVLKINTDKTYSEHFKKIYNNTVTPLNLVDALSCYTQSLVSFNSRFDSYIRNESDDLTTEEKSGFNLFTGKAKCATCHFIPLFNGLVPPNYMETESEILGVPKSKQTPKTIDPDKGKYLYTQFDIHEYAFKTPGIRNANLTAPYMHNGVFTTLEEVVEFYNAGGGAGQGMKLENQTLAADSLKLSKKEVSDIVKFIESLTDESLKN